MQGSEDTILKPAYALEENDVVFEGLVRKPITALVHNEEETMIEYADGSSEIVAYDQRVRVVDQ